MARNSHSGSFVYTSSQYYSILLVLFAIVLILKTNPECIYLGPFFRWCAFSSICTDYTEYSYAKMREAPLEYLTISNELLASIDCDCNQ